MYINKIDELVNNVIDDFYAKMGKKPELHKMSTESNFVRFQKDINTLLMEYNKTINRGEINKILEDEENGRKIYELLKRYVAYYFFLTIGFFYAGKPDTFINNIVELTRNQPSFPLKIANFFNSESNSQIIILNNLAHNILIVISADSNRRMALHKKPEYDNAFSFVNTFGEEFINTLFRLENIGGDKSLQAHNIIKTIIINELYIGLDKHDVQLILDKKEKDTGEYTYIEIVVPRRDYIDYNTIEAALSESEVERGVASEIYELLTNFEDVQKIKTTTDNRILDLLNSGFLVPITEDFLLYHKENEKYDKYLENNKASIKREDTRIKYIVTKIDSVSEYYSANTLSKKNVKQEIEKNFSVPLSNRKAVIVNNTENIKIINKLHLQGRTAIDSNEYYNDLVHYMLYPYINFRDFSTSGFSISMEKTIDVVRYVNFDAVNRKDSHHDIQMRVGSEGYILNIVGFVLHPQKSIIQCYQPRDLVNVRNIEYKKKSYTNGYEGCLKYIQYQYSGKKAHRPIYWLFDLSKDKIIMDTYDMSKKINDGEHLKLILSKLHSEIINIMLAKIVELVNNHKSITLQQFYPLIHHIEKHFFPINKEFEVFKELERYIYYEKAAPAKDEYDIQEDIFYGFGENVIKLPSYKKPIIKSHEVNIYNVTNSKTNKGMEYMEAEQVGAICQHNVTWDNLTALRKKNPNKFTRYLFEFIQQYIEQNYDDDFICKSCGTLVNLKNYVQDGTYDSEGRFVTFSSTLDIPLEDIREYEKYKPSIRNIEKIVERLASITNVNTLVGLSSAVKHRIRSVVKDTIDMLLIHNSNLKKTQKERQIQNLSKYGIKRELTNLFSFELENNIFIFSSKDKDYYKPIKRNNILIYVMLMIVLELSDTQLFYMSGDKICNYYIFEKYGVSWFADLHVVKNDKGDILPMRELPTLCYILFYMSCMITKYGMWQRDASEEKTKKFDPLIQKIIINTFVDCCNSVIELYGQKRKHYLYDIVANKYFQKMNDLFRNKEILAKIKEIEDKKMSTDVKKKKIVSVRAKPILLVGEYTNGQYYDILDYVRCHIHRYYIPKITHILAPFMEISNKTNCHTTGQFHIWKRDGPIFVCQVCGKKPEDPNRASSNEIRKLYHEYTIRHNLTQYCKNGMIKCEDFDKINIKELEKRLSTIAKQNRLETATLVNKEEQKKLSERSDFITELRAKFAKTKSHKTDFYRHIDLLMEHFESLVGKTPDIGYNQQLKNDVYIIDHDHNGFALPGNPIVIVNDGNKIQEKKNHPWFKTDVIYYTNFKLAIDVYYNAKTYLLLGYKERNKDFQLSTRPTSFLKINYSILNRLKMLGFDMRYYDVENEVQELKKFIDDDQQVLKTLISDLARQRVDNIKRAMSIIQRNVNRIRFSYIPKRTEGIEETFDDKLGHKYNKKLKPMVLSNKNETFLEHWKQATNGIFFDGSNIKTINLNVKDKFLSYIDIADYDYSGNLLSYYLTSEMSKLISINTDKSVKVNVIYLLIDLIINIHKLLNEEVVYTNLETRRFNYILASRDYAKEIETFGGETEGFYGEYKDPDAPEDPDAQEALYDAQEEQDAMDVEGDLDYEIDYTDGVNMG